MCACVCACVCNVFLQMTPPERNSLVSDKTGKTGAAVIGLGVAAYLASKEARQHKTLFSLSLSLALLMPCSRMCVSCPDSHPPQRDHCRGLRGGRHLRAHDQGGASARLGWLWTLLCCAHLHNGRRLGRTLPARWTSGRRYGGGHLCSARLPLAFPPPTLLLAVRNPGAGGG
jgi:hypothetical protein